MKKILFISLLLVCFMPFFNVYANDTDLYILTQLMEQIPPDALIVLDLSGSMDWTPSGASSYNLYYDPGACTHTSHGNCTSWTHNCGDNNIPYYTTSASPHTTACSFTSTQTIWGDADCAGPFYYTQNYTGTPASQTKCTQSKLGIAKRAIFKFLDVDDGSSTGIPDGIIDSRDQDYLKIRMGYMRYYNCNSSETVTSSSYNSGCNTLIDSLNTPYSTIYCKNATSCTQSVTGTAISVVREDSVGGTPLAAAEQEAKYYFDNSKAGDVDAACRQKFVILITDGDDTYACSGNGQEGQTTQYKMRRETVAQARALANAGYYVFIIGFGSNMPTHLQNTLNWAAYYGKTKNTETTQSITSMYTIPFGQTYPTGVTQCMNSQYTNGGTFGSYGTYYYANTNDPGRYGISGYAFIAQNATQLNDAIMTIRNFIITLNAQSTSYVAPVVPISQFQSTSSENRLYLGMFKPTATTMWKGNIKKYGIATTATSTIAVGDLVDVNNALVMTSSNTIQDSAQSYWSTTADGGDVERGGIGKVLLDSDLNARKIYTLTGTSANLAASSNAFTKTNTAITATLLGVTTSGEKDNVVDFVHGWDAWGWNSGPGTKRDWILGALIHSRPLVIHYTSQDVIYAGANDGMLHAFNDSTGAELWAFIPPELLPNLKKFNDSLSSLQTFVDGTPRAYASGSQVILIFGLRRGGSQYYALDVTNPTSPVFLWSISPTKIINGTTSTASTAYQELGQTWSTPFIGKIRNGSGAKYVTFIGGGYDTNQDSASPGSDAHGRAVYVIDVTNGSQIWKYSFSDNSNMKYCIPADITPVDTNGDGFIERLYVGDLGGQVWRFDIGNMNDMASWTDHSQIVFKGSGKIFYSPDVSFEKDIGSGTYSMLFFGTGDREKPHDTTFVNTLYAIKDYDAAPTTVLDGALVDVTADVLQSSTASESTKNTQLNLLKSGPGWLIRLNQSAGESPNPGEKCDAPAVIFGGAVYYTTFTPTPVNSSSACDLGTGKGFIYALQYQTGSSVFDQNEDGQITAADRSIDIGSGIPSGIIITIISGQITGYGGVAGGVFSPTLTTTNSIIPLDWRIVF